MATTSRITLQPGLGGGTGRQDEEPAAKRECRREGGKLTKVNSSEATGPKGALDDEVCETVGSLGPPYLERSLLRLYWPLRMLEHLVLRLDPFMERCALSRYRRAVLEREREGGEGLGGSVGRGCGGRGVGRVDDPVVSDV